MAIDLQFIAAVLPMACLLVGIYLLERQANAGRKLTESEILFLLARITETSEFEQFRRAAMDWNISEKQAEADFKRYLFQSQLPYYVQDYIRKAKHSNPDLLEKGTNFFTGILIDPKSKRT